MAHKTWIDVGSDVNWQDYGGTWARKVAPGRYHFINFGNWEDMVGGDAAGGPTYNCALSEVDLNLIPQDEVDSAAEFCDLDSWIDDEVDVEVDVEVKLLAIATACHSYGCKAPLEEWNSHNARKLIADARRLSRSLDDDDLHAAAMERPVNRIGSTAAEYMTGDMSSATLRGLAAGSVEADILARMGCLR